jgi:Mg2+-importing ATPase
MISMTGASLLLPFLPMLPIQVLLNNFLYDLSQVAIPTDEVDQDYLETPKPWDIGAIRKFMMIIGPVSSIFDFITFGVLYFVFRFSTPMFQTGWFLESLCTQTLVIHVIRTSKVPFIQSRPSRFLVFTSILIVCVGLAIPLSPLGHYFGFKALPGTFFLALAAIVVCYLVMTHFVKTWFVKKYGY